MSHRSYFFQICSVVYGAFEVSFQLWIHLWLVRSLNNLQFNSHLVVSDQLSIRSCSQQLSGHSCYSECNHTSVEPSSRDLLSRIDPSGPSLVWIPYHILYRKSSGPVAVSAMEVYHRSPTYGMLATLPVAHL